MLTATDNHWRLRSGSNTSSRGRRYSVSTEEEDDEEPKDDAKLARKDENLKGMPIMSGASSEENSDNDGLKFKPYMGRRNAVPEGPPVEDPQQRIGQ